MDRMIENLIEWIDGDSRVAVTLSSRSKRMQNRISKVVTEHSAVSDCIVNDDGSMIAHFPITWLHISAPRKLNLTEEQRLIMSERLQNARTQRLTRDDIDEESMETDEDEEYTM